MKHTAKPAGCRLQAPPTLSAMSATAGLSTYSSTTLTACTAGPHMVRNMWRSNTPRPASELSMCPRGVKDICSMGVT
jgi:hypothetical protein